MMREMTDGEVYSWYVRGQWPCGHGSEYIPGPRGGISRNITCPTCKMMMNVTDPDYDTQVPWGQIIEAPPRYKPPSVPILERLRRLLARK